MLQWIKNLFFQKEKYKNEILLCIATIEDLDFLEDCIQAGSSEKHFREMSRDEIKKAIKHQTQNSILAVIKSAETNIDIGFLYVGKNNRIFESGTQEVISGYEINLLYILEPYRKNGIGTKTILQI